MKTIFSVTISCQNRKLCNVVVYTYTGLKTEDVVVQIVGRDILQVTGRLKGGNEARAGKWHIKERPSGSFFRKFQLPSNVKVNEITAFDEQDGVLVISIPKRKSFIRDVPIAKL